MSTRAVNTVHGILTLEVTVCCFATTHHTFPVRRDSSGQLHSKFSVLGPGLRCAGSCGTNDALVYITQSTVVYQVRHALHGQCRQLASRESHRTHARTASQF